MMSKNLKKEDFPHCFFMTYLNLQLFSIPNITSPQCLYRKFLMEKHKRPHFIDYIKYLRGAFLEIISPTPHCRGRKILYAKKYTEGDLEAKHILIERNLRLVAHIVKKYQSFEEDTEDLLSIGTIGLIKAVVTFNPDKCVRLSLCGQMYQYEFSCIFGQKRNLPEISLYEPIGTDREGNEIQAFRYYRDRRG